MWDFEAVWEHYTRNMEMQINFPVKDQFSYHRYVCFFGSGGKSISNGFLYLGLWLPQKKACTSPQKLSYLLIYINLNEVQECLQFHVLINWTFIRTRCMMFEIRYTLPGPLLFQCNTVYKCSIHIVRVEISRLYIKLPGHVYKFKVLTNNEHLMIIYNWDYSANIN